MGHHRSATVRRQLRRAAATCVEPLELRLLLSITTTVNHGLGFGGATDMTLNGGASITGPTDAAAPNALQITNAGGNEARSAFTTQNQGVDSFDTTFTWVYDRAAPPNADGFTFTLEAGAPTAVGYLGYAIGYAGIDAAHPGIQNSIAVKFDLWNGGPSATETGLYANGVGIDASDAPLTNLTTTAAPIGTTVNLTTAPDGSSTGLDFHANANDTYQAHLVYTGGTTIAETLTDLSQSPNIIVNQTFDLGGKTVAQIIGSHAAHAGFTGGTGGANAIQDIKSWTYSGTEANVTQLNPPVLTSTTTLGGEIVLNYTSPGGQIGFEIDQSSDNGATFQPIATVGASVLQQSVAGLDPTKSYQFRVRALGDNTTTLTSPFSNVVTQSAAGTPPSLRGQPSLPGEVDLFFNSPFADRTGFEVDQSSDGGATFQPIATLPGNASNYMVTGLDTTKTYQFEVKVTGNGTRTHNTPPSAPLIAIGAGLPSPTTVNDSNFTSGSGLTLNGSATLTGASGTPANALRLADGHNNEASSAYHSNPQLVDNFDATFDFTFGSTVAPNADGLAFVLQNDGPTALGALGFGMGFQGVVHGIGVFFNLYPTASQTGLWLPSGRSQVNDLTLQGFDFHANPADTYHVHLVYDAGTLTETLTDTNLNLTGTVTFTGLSIPQLVGSHAGLVGFSGGTGGLNSEQDVLDFSYTGRAGGTLAAPVANAISCAPGVIDIGFSELTPNTGGYQVYQSTDFGSTFTPIATVPSTARYYEATGLDPNTTYEFEVKALGNGSNTTDSAVSNVVMPIQQTTAPQPLDFSGGFTDPSTTAIQLNGAASFTGATPASPMPANALQITPAQNTKIGSAFSSTPQLIGNFDTQFDLISPTQTSPPADGLTFVIQSQAPTAIGTATGGGLGYGPEAVGQGDGSGIRPSVAIKFDLYSNFGEGTNSTGLFVNGDGPTVPGNNIPEETSIDMTSSGLVLGIQGDVYRVHLSYDGTTLHESITDLEKSTSFTHDYTIDLSRYVEAGCAYVGFAGATGGLNTEQDILNWKFTGSRNASSNTVNGTAGNDTITLRKNADGIHDDIWVNAPASGPASQQALIGQTIVINGGGGADTVVIDSSNGNPLPTGSAGTVLRLVGGTGAITVQGILPNLDASHLLDIGKSNAVQIPYTGASPLSSVQTLLKNGVIESTDAAGSSGKFGVADVDNGSQITLSYRVIGDLNGDGTVNFNDLLALAQNYNSSGKDWSKGDLTYDGSVNFNDLLALAQHYNDSAAAGPALASSTTSADLLLSTLRTRKTASALGRHK